MAKKSFKGGLGSLLENTFNNAGIKKEDLTPTKDDVSLDDLKKELEICKAELSLWRLGELDKELFDESLKNEGLTYNSNTNSIEKMS